MKNAFLREAALATEASTGTETAQGTQTGTQTAQTAQTGKSGIQEPWEKSWIKPDFTLDHSALERLPDHRKGLKELLSRQKSLDDVFGVLQNSQMLAGKKGLAPLPPDAPDNVKAERKQLLDTINGVPPKPSDYAIQRPEFVPESQWNPKLVESTSAWAHKHSVSPAALKELTETNMNLVKEQLAEQQNYETRFYQEQQKAFEAQIRNENIPADKANALAERGATGLGVNLEDPANQALMKNATFRLAMMRHAMAIAEDTTVQANGAGAGAVDPAKQASDIMHNKANPLYEQYWNREGKFPRAVHEAAVAKVNELWKLSTAPKKK